MAGAVAGDGVRATPLRAGRCGSGGRTWDRTVAVCLVRGSSRSAGDMTRAEDADIVDGLSMVTSTAMDFSGNWA